MSGYTRPHKDGTVWEKLAFDLGWRKLNETSGFYAKDNFFATTNCIIRRRFWKKYPFNEEMSDTIPNSDRFGGEDYDWALEMLARGYRVVVEPKFNVYHSHKDTISQLISKFIIWRRIRKEMRSLSRPRKSYTKVFELKPRCIEI